MGEHRVVDQRTARTASLPASVYPGVVGADRFDLSHLLYNSVTDGDWTGPLWP